MALANATLESIHRQSGEEGLEVVEVQCKRCLWDKSQLLCLHLDSMEFKQDGG